MWGAAADILGRVDSPAAHRRREDHTLVAEAEEDILRELLSEAEEVGWWDDAVPGRVDPADLAEEGRMSTTADGPGGS